MPRHAPSAAVVCLTVAALVGGPLAHADVLPDKAFPGSVVYGKLHVLSVHAEGRQLVVAAPEYHLAVRADLPPGVAPRPTRLAWVVPLPTPFDRVVPLPAGTPVWGELRHWGLRHLSREESGGSPTRTPFATTRSTDLKITASAGPAAVAELNGWLAGSGFAAIDPARLDPLAARGYRFALATYAAVSDAEPLPATGILPAIAVERWSVGLGLPVQLAGALPLELSVFSLSKSGLEPAREALGAWLGTDLSPVELAAAEDLPATIEVVRGGPALALPKLTGHWFAGRITGRIDAGRVVNTRDAVALAGAADLESRHDAGADRKRKVVMFAVVMVLGLGLGILYGKARERRLPSDEALPYVR